MTATHNTQAVALAALRATPPTVPNSVIGMSPVFESTDTVTPNASAEASSIIRILRVPSNARLSELEMEHGAYTAGAVDIGLYFTAGHAKVPAKNATVGASATDNTLTDVGGIFTDGGGTNTDYGLVIDADYFCSALTIATGGITGFDGTGAATTGLVATNTKYNLLTESGTNTIAKHQQPLWQAVGLNGDPGGFFDIVLTVTTAFQVATAISMRARYTV